MWKGSVEIDVFFELGCDNMSAPSSENFELFGRVNRSELKKLGLIWLSFFGSKRSDFFKFRNDSIEIF